MFEYEGFSGTTNSNMSDTFNDMFATRKCNAYLYHSLRALDESNLINVT